MNLCSIVGARPQFVKLAAVSRALGEHANHAILHTGQHYDSCLSGSFFDDLGIPAPDWNLEIGSGPQGLQTGRMMEGIERILRQNAPDCVILYGDTNSTLAGALAAVKLGIPVAHVEAGLRSFRKAMPEEVNRVLTDHVSTVLFCPTTAAVANLRREGFGRIACDGELAPMDCDLGGLQPTMDSPLVINVGDVMYDIFLRSLQRAKGESDILAELGLQDVNFALATVHRAENTNEPSRIRTIFEALNEVAGMHMRVVCPLHPRSRTALERLDPAAQISDLRLIPPVSYSDMLRLETNARFIVTDSGGVQKEAYFAGVPCVTVREETEWPELVEMGWNHLVGADRDRLLATIEELESPASNSRVSHYGDGHAADRLVHVLLRRWGSD